MNKKTNIAIYVDADGCLEYFDNYEELLTNIPRIEEEEFSKLSTRANTYYKTIIATLRCYGNHNFIRNEEYFSTFIQLAHNGLSSIRSTGIPKLSQVSGGNISFIHPDDRFGVRPSVVDIDKKLSSWELICGYQYVSTIEQCYPRPYVTFYDWEGYAGTSITFGVTIQNKAPYGHVLKMANFGWNDRARSLKLFFSDYNVPAN